MCDPTGQDTKFDSHTKFMTGNYFLQNDNNIAEQISPVIQF
jgi:hypothetical protein